MAMSGLGMANLDEHTSKQDFNNKVGRRMQYTYFMQYTSVHKPRKTTKKHLKQSWNIHIWEGFESQGLNIVCNTWKAKSFNKKMPDKFQEPLTNTKTQYMEGQLPLFLLLLSNKL